MNEKHFTRPVGGAQDREPYGNLGCELEAYANRPAHTELLPLIEQKPCKANEFQYMHHMYLCSAQTWANQKRKRADITPTAASTRISDDDWSNFVSFNVSPQIKSDPNLTAPENPSEPFDFFADLATSQ
ncbi:hypothetical protein SAY86_013355 [Trapa natans]|uniref:Uncharacterized protein n=1 Tax=Trapa natans TaxID=22666 RepID=A0AAN7RCH9_TRANT|nr:hypothetical protein SAY86_013355 [Trapa natans]